MLRLCWWRQCLSLVTIQTSSQISNRNWNVRTCHKLNQRKSEWESFLHSSHNLCSELLKYIEYQKGMMRRDDVVTAIIVSKKVLSSALTRVRPYKNEIWVSESIPVRTITCVPDFIVLWYLAAGLFSRSLRLEEAKILYFIYWKNPTFIASYKPPSRVRRGFMSHCKHITLHIVTSDGRDYLATQHSTRILLNVV